MGHGIAQALAIGGVDVSIVEPSQEAAARVRSRGTPGVTVRPLEEAIPGADLVIEAVPEILELKRALWREVDALAARDTMLATNTSSFEIDTLAEVITDPERFLGLHWFHPATVVPGVEVVAGTRTDRQVVEDAAALMAAVGKKPVIVRSSPGFVANRLQFVLFREALLCLEEGLASPQEIDEIVRATFGPRLGLLGPLLSADMGGLDTYQSILEYLESNLGERFAPTTGLSRLVAEGSRGAKSGSGIAGRSPADYAVVASTVADRLPSLYDGAGSLLSDPTGAP